MILRRFLPETADHAHFLRRACFPPWPPGRPVSSGCVRRPAIRALNDPSILWARRTILISAHGIEFREGREFLLDPGGSDPVRTVELVVSEIEEDGIRTEIRQGGARSATTFELIADAPKFMTSIPGPGKMA